MDALECIRTRRSIRKYKDISVEWEKVGAIIEAGMRAPSSGNLQNWKFIIVLDDAKRKAIAEACLQQAWIATAPVIIVVIDEPERNKRFYGIRGERLYSIQSCAAAAENMLLAAHSLGLGACWIGAFDESRIRSILGIIDEVRPQIIITIGYADEVPLELPKYKIENVAYFNRWQARIKDINAIMGYTSAAVQRNIQKGKEILEKINRKLMKE